MTVQHKPAIDVAAVCGGFWWDALAGVYKAIPCGHCSGEGLRWLQAQRDFVAAGNGEKMHDPENFESVVNEYYDALTSMIGRGATMGQQSVEEIILGAADSSSPTGYSIQLQGIGLHPALPVKELKAGATLVFNFGIRSQLKSIKPNANGTSYTLVIVSEKSRHGPGGEFKTTKRANTLMGVIPSSVAQQSVEEIILGQLAKCSPAKARKVERCIRVLKDDPNVNPYGVCQESVKCSLPSKRFKEFGQDMIRQPSVEQVIRELENRVIRVVSTKELVNA